MKPNELKNKTRIQVSVDTDLKNEAVEILNNLGMTPTSAVNILFKRIVATDSYPVNLQMTEKEKATLELKKTLKNVPVKDLNTPQEISDFFEDGDNDNQN